jgi:hypothetical protein
VRRRTAPATGSGGGPGEPSAAPRAIATSRRRLNPSPPPDHPGVAHRGEQRCNPCATCSTLCRYSKYLGFNALTVPRGIASAGATGPLHRSNWSPERPAARSSGIAHALAGSRLCARGGGLRRSRRNAPVTTRAGNGDRRQRRPPATSARPGPHRSRLDPPLAPPAGAGPCGAPRRPSRSRTRPG